jgi:hypothetical protein
MPEKPDALAERRERAKDAYHDELSGGSIESGSDPVDVFAEAIDAAIETATRVEITPEVVAAFRDARRDPASRTPDGLKAAFEAAGFEVTNATA